MERFRKSLFAFILLTLSFSGLQAQKPAVDYSTRLALIQKNIDQVFYMPQTGLYLETNDPAHNEKPNSYLWPLCALYQATNEREVLEPSKNYMAPVRKAIEQYHNTVPPVPGYQAYIRKAGVDTRFYDDNQWIGITALDAYNRTQKKDYLTLGEDIYRFMMVGYDQAAGGGIYWKEDDKTTKNTCSNGPGILVALELYRITKQKAYLDKAVLLYDWTNKHLLAPEGVYYDAIKLPSLRIDSARYTYNTGTMLQANALLYKLTKKQAYLTEAQRLAKTAKAYFYRNNKLPHDYWFNAVLLRGYLELYSIDKDKSRLQFFIDDAERIWQEERDAATNLLGRHTWKTLIDQAAMLEIYARLELLQNRKK
ncbi:glycoside hydrolase family 76 protein [Tellurirhabdus bombi]|uniref:glycoside hydrolase family 76 protein n=1 Tax=Tellurirhabdus bombi TaxID=2907205 RepID=UPI001F3975CC|nr:glycoside hydrolase family 76 protein [Tellurirhabdus bombi]